jgi:hypothetical protein
LDRNNFIEGSYKNDNFHTIRDVLAFIGMADVTFGIEWKDCEIIMEKPGFKLEVNPLDLG